MTTHQPATTTGPTCPTCGEPLQREGASLRCAEHGQFFRYGPRLLVRAPSLAPEEQPLLPWQTMTERAVS